MRYLTVGQFNRRWEWLQWGLSKLSPYVLDVAYRHARDLQHREEDGWYVAEDGTWKRCRIQSTEWDDPIMQESGCSGEFYSDFLHDDIRDGCPRCLCQVMENASEPDVMARRGFGR